MQKPMLWSVAFLVFSVSIASAQVLSVSPLNPTSDQIAGTCVDKSRVRAVVTRGANETRLEEIDCASGKFRMSLSLIPLRNGDVVRIDQILGAANSSVSTVVTSWIVTPPTASTIHAGDVAISGACAEKATIAVSVVSGGNEITLQPVTCSAGKFTAKAAQAQLKLGDSVRLVQSVDGTPSNAFLATVSELDSPADEREDFEASAYLGIAVDTFASEEINRYLNQDANGRPKERGVFGFDFGYGLVRKEKAQLWVYGETVHGVRSDDVDCEKNAAFPTCKKSLADFVATNGFKPDNALFMLRNATSLEAFVGLRLESKPINRGRHPAVLYGKGQLGFINVANSDGDAKDMHHFAVGALAVGGPLMGSYLEFGRGRTDLFASNRYKRFKIDGHLQFRVTDKYSFFAQIFSDLDGSRGADSIQTYFGLSFDLDELFGGGTAAAAAAVTKP